MIEISELDYEQLDSLSKDEKFELLRNEYDIYQINFDFYFRLNELNEDKIIKILDSVVNANSNHEVTQGGEYPAKQISAIFNYSGIEESEFLFYLKILYLNDYIENIIFEEFDIKEESKDIFYEEFLDSTRQIRFNLHRLYRTDKELFNEELYFGLPNINSEKAMYDKFLKFGSIVEKAISWGNLIRLSNKGMHYLHFVTSKRSLKLMHKQEELLQNIIETKAEQGALLIKFEDYKHNQERNLESVNSSLNKYDKKINSFYKDITTILSIMVAAFSLIGVNISAIPKIENNFTANVLALNLSLIIVLLVLFYILRVIVYGEIINLKQFYGILSISIIGIVGIFIFLGFNHESKIDVIEKRYEQKISDYTERNRKEILNLKKQIEELNNSLK